MYDRSFMLGHSNLFEQIAHQISHQITFTSKFLEPNEIFNVAAPHVASAQHKVRIPPDRYLHDY